MSQLLWQCQLFLIMPFLWCSVLSPYSYLPPPLTHTPTYTNAQFDYVLVFPLTEGAYADPSSRSKDVGERVKWDMVSAIWSKGHKLFSFSPFSNICFLSAFFNLFSTSLFFYHWIQYLTFSLFFYIHPSLFFHSFLFYLTLPSFFILLFSLFFRPHSSLCLS